MNLKEGFRRTGILLGVLGATAGVVLAYVTAPPLWQTWREHEKFQALLTTPMVRSVSGADWAAKHPQSIDKWRWCNGYLTGTDASASPSEAAKSERGELLGHDFNGTPVYNNSEPPTRNPAQEADGSCSEISVAEKGRLHWTGDGSYYGSLRLDSFAPQPNRDGIAAIYYDVSGAVTSLKLATGAVVVEPPSPPHFVQTLVPLLFPLIGFLLPWGVTKSLSWVVTGFAGRT